MRTWAKKYFQGFLKLFLQSSCPLCQRQTSEEFCPDCTRQLLNCHLKDPNFLWKQPLPVFVWGAYRGSLKRAIAVMKYENHPEIARPLGQWLGEAWMLHSELSNKQPVVVPIPLHKSRQKERGFNQAALIAESFCEITGFKLKQNGLQRMQNTQAQFGLSVSERQKNLAKAFEIGEDFRRLPDAPVLLVDDIYTTGATARAAVETLHQNRITVCGLVATATTAKSG
jgi:ComF family protein